MVSTKATLKWRRALMEDNLKIWNFEYLSSHWSDLYIILNISSWDQTKVKNGFDDLKIWKVEYLSSHWSDLPRILNLSSWDQTKVKKVFNKDNLQWKTTSNGRWTLNMKRWISQQALIGSSSNFKHKLMGPHQSQKKFQWTRPSMEYDL